MSFSLWNSKYTSHDQAIFGSSLSVVPIVVFLSVLVVSVPLGLRVVECPGGHRVEEGLALGLVGWGSW